MRKSSKSRPQYGGLYNSGRRIAAHLARRVGRHYGEKVGRYIAQRFQHRKGESYTKTLTEEKKEKMGNDIEHDDVKQKIFRFKLADKKKSVDYSAGKTSFTTTYSGTCRSVAGILNWSTIAHFGATQQWLMATSTAGSLWSKNQMPIAYFQLNPSARNTGSTVLATSAQSPVDRLCLEKVHMRIETANFTNVTTHVTYYVLQSKCNHNWVPDLLLSQIEAREVGASLYATALVPPAAGLGVGGVAGYHDNSTNFVNGPTFYKEFNKFFKVLKVRRCILTSASQEMMDLKFEVNNIGDASVLLNLNPAMDPAAPATWTAANTVVNYPRGHVCVMACVRGAMVDDVTASTAGVPTYGATKVGTIINTSYTFRSLKSTTNRFSADAGFDQLPYNTAVANQWFMDVLDNQTSKEES